MNDDFLLIGIDGGATKVNGWSLDIDEKGKSFSLGEWHSGKSYNEIEGFIENFQPVDINVQLAQMKNGSFEIAESEAAQSKVYIEACSEVIKDIVEKSGTNRILVGIGLPGLKTEDKRGVAAMANGPRLMQYSEILEKRLAAYGIDLVEPISQLGSDAYYCGLGEEYALKGQFKMVQNSYYLGGGTGAADALKINGSLLSLDDIKNWFVKTWEIKTSEGLSTESYVSARGIQSIYGNIVGVNVSSLTNQGVYPPQIREKALQGVGAAIETFRRVSYYLALLLYERITTLNIGWQNLFTFVNPNRSEPEKEHDYLGTTLESIIVGQRLGDLLRSSEGDDVLWGPLFNHLTSFITESVVLSDEVKDYYCPEGYFSRNIIKVSNLREAPAIGAGADAYLTWRCVK